MPVGSVSKQFCAAAILMLRDKGELSLDDTLSKYFPEYEIGKDITLKQLLSMQSGIYDMVNEGVVDDMSADNSEEANTEVIKNWIFSKELKFEPGSTMSYSNSNYFLLGNIVEQVSGEKYMDFLRENIFKPIGMNNTGDPESKGRATDPTKQGEPFEVEAKAELDKDLKATATVDGATPDYTEVKGVDADLTSDKMKKCNCKDGKCSHCDCEKAEVKLDGECIANKEVKGGIFRRITNKK
jgi:CubicO group peptidase (beta-lactamase class C family)